MTVTSIFFETSRQRLAPRFQELGSLDRCNDYVFDRLTPSARPSTVLSVFIGDGRSMLDVLELFADKRERRNGMLGACGRAARRPLCDGIMQALVHEGGTGPVFAIIDHQGAHHWSYVLADHAFAQARSAAGGRLRAVVSFDAGRDTAAASEHMTSRNWGAQLFERFARLDPASPSCADTDAPAADALLIIGQRSDTRTHAPTEVVRMTERGLETLDAGIHLARVIDGHASMDELLDEALMRMVGVRDRCAAWAGCDVYVTIDRSFLRGSCTPQGDGDYDPVAGRMQVAACVRALGGLGARLVGVNVCGLPTSAILGNPEVDDVHPTMVPYRSRWHQGAPARDIVDHAIIDINTIFTAAAVVWGSI